MITSAMLHAAARAAYEAVRAYRQGKHDLSMAPYDQASDEALRQALLEVRGVVSGQHGRELHRLWSEKAAKGGWTYGEVLDEEKKEHPDLRPYEAMPELPRMRDMITERVTMAILYALGASPEDFAGKVIEVKIGADQKRPLIFIGVGDEGVFVHPSQADGLHASLGRAISDVKAREGAAPS